MSNADTVKYVSFEVPQLLLTFSTLCVHACTMIYVDYNSICTPFISQFGSDHGLRIKPFNYRATCVSSMQSKRMYTCSMELIYAVMYILCLWKNWKQNLILFSLFIWHVKATVNCVVTKDGDRLYCSIPNKLCTRRDQSRFWRYEYKCGKMNSCCFTYDGSQHYGGRKAKNAWGHLMTIRRLQV